MAAPPFELDDGRTTAAPATEDQAVRQALAEDEERAKRLGLKRSVAAPPGRDWVHTIGGGDNADAKATRLLQEEAQAKARRAEARAGAVRSIAVSILLLAVIAAAAAAAADYCGLVHLGLFEQPVDPPAAAIPTPEAAPSQPVQAPQPVSPPEQPLVVGTPAPVIAATAPVDPAALRRAQDKAKSKQRGLDYVTRDLAEKRAKVDDECRQLYGFVPSPRGRNPEPREWQSPCALLELRQAQNGGSGAQAMTRLQNAQAAVNNLTAYLAQDRRTENDLQKRLEKATRERDEATTALRELGGE